MAQSFTIEAETKKFNSFINNFMKKSSVDTDKALKKFAFDLIARVVRKSPVATGRSRAGWYVGMTKLGGAGAAFLTPPTKKVLRNKFNKKGEVSEGRQKSDFNNHTGPTKLIKYIEIINGVDYIVYLEYGYSDQAAYGMVRVSMRELTKTKLPKDLATRYKKSWNEFRW